MKNLRKKNETETQNTMEGHSSRIEKTEDRISELEDEMAIKGKTEELLVKQHKTYEKKMQELTDSIKRTNLRIMGTKEGEKVQVKGMHNNIQQNNDRKLPKSRENCAHSCTGSFQNTKQT
jgi:chromosome segregation ATPase